MKCSCNNGKVLKNPEEIEVRGFTMSPKVYTHYMTKATWETCGLCDGTGVLTEQAGFNNPPPKLLTREWCHCGNKSGDVSFFRHGHVHGYTCVECGGLVQLG